MELLEKLAQAAWERDSLTVRSLAQELVRTYPQLALIARPTTPDEHTMVMAAALLEVLAMRTGQAAPPWTATIGAAADGFYLVAAAETMPRLRLHCESEAPEPLRTRRLYAPADFLAWA